MRSGGGLAGNLPPGSLTAIEATLIGGGSAAGKLKVQQGLATEGGDDAETLAQAEQRIPACSATATGPSPRRTTANWPR